MSELREQLHRLRDAYGGIRYDGDLARDVIVAGPRRAPWLTWVGAAAALAAAAAIVLLVIVQAQIADDAGRSGGHGGIAMTVVEPPPQQPERAEEPIVVASAETTPTLWNSFESVPSLFQSLSAAGGDDGPAVPSFPSFSEVEVSVQTQQGAAEDAD